MPKPLLNIKKLLKTRSEGQGYELYIPNLQIRQGEFWALLGQSGSGKSTALDIIALILRPDSCQKFSLNTRSGSGFSYDFSIPDKYPKSRAEYLLNSRPNNCAKNNPLNNTFNPVNLNSTQLEEQALPKASPQASFDQIYFNAAKAWSGGNLDSLANIRAKHFGYVLQIGGLLPFLNVRDNIMLARKTANLTGEGPVPELVEQLGIKHLLNKKIDQISVGERQRVAIARALAHEPSLVLADEPTSALDPITAADVLNLLISLTRKQQAALLVASHDWEAVRRAGFRELHVEVDMGRLKTDDPAGQKRPIRAVLRKALRGIKEADGSELFDADSNNGVRRPFNGIYSRPDNRANGQNNKAGNQLGKEPGESLAKDMAGDIAGGIAGGITEDLTKNLDENLADGLDSRRDNTRGRT